MVAHMESSIIIHTDLYLKVEPLLNRLTVEGRRVISVFTDLKGVRKKELKLERQTEAGYS